MFRVFVLLKKQGITLDDVLVSFSLPATRVTFQVVLSMLRDP